MSQRPERLVKLISVKNEMEAVPLVAALREQGIPARLVGSFIAGFRAEAPGEVQILVADEHVPKARAAIESAIRETSDIDWSQVDVGQPEEVGNS